MDPEHTRHGMTMEDELDLKHADSNSSIPPPPPPMPPVASVESDDLPDPDEETGMKPGMEPLAPGSVDELPPGMVLETLPPQDYEMGGHPMEEGKVTTVVVEDKKERGEGCCDRFLRCLSYVPCGSLIAWIILLLGLGALAGSLIIGTRKLRLLLEDTRFLWFMEYSVTGIVVSMFVLGTLFLVAAHLSTDPTSRRLFNSMSKNRCARGFNIFLLVLVYILCLCWMLLSLLLATPIVMLSWMFVVTENYSQSGDCFELRNYGFPEREICYPQPLGVFKDDAKDVLICYGVGLLSCFLVVVSLIHFLICISANITHLRDNRFATLNAYEAEEVRNSKHSVLDTNM